MKIKVTTERDCRHVSEDLVRYQGMSQIAECMKLKFCKHCGQLWYLNSFTDAAGSRDTEYIRFVPTISPSDLRP